LVSAGKGVEREILAALASAFYIHQWNKNIASAVILMLLKQSSKNSANLQLPKLLSTKPSSLKDNGGPLKEGAYARTGSATSLWLLVRLGEAVSLQNLCYCSQEKTFQQRMEIQYNNHFSLVLCL